MSATARRLSCAVALASLLLTSCEYSLDVAAAWEITQPRVIGVGMAVVEPTDLWPERFADTSVEVPFAQALPGDRVRLVPMVVDADGREQPPETIDALWFQCEPDEACAIDVPRCEDIEWTTDVACEIGRGGAHVFEMPALGPAGLERHRLSVLGIIGRTPEADAERCRAGYLSASPELSACTLVIAEVMLGPRWVLLIEADAAGLEVEFPLHEIPYPALLQLANRPPAPDPMILLDAESGEPLPGDPPRARPGQRVRTEGPRWRIGDYQLFAIADEVGVSDTYVFGADFGRLGVRYMASGPVLQVERDGAGLELVVDDVGQPDTIRIVAIVGDRRSEDDREQYTLDMFVQELEVVP